MNETFRTTKSPSSSFSILPLINFLTGSIVQADWESLRISKNFKKPIYQKTLLICDETYISSNANALPVPKHRKCLQETFIYFLCPLTSNTLELFCFQEKVVLSHTQTVNYP